MTGIDQEPLAVRSARARAAKAGVHPTLVAADITRMSPDALPRPFDVVLDLCCFHGIPANRRDAYVDVVSSVAASGATFLLLTFGRGPISASPQEVESRFGGLWEIQARWDASFRRLGKPSWYRLRRRGASSGMTGRTERARLHGYLQEDQRS